MVRLNESIERKGEREGVRENRSKWERERGGQRRERREELD